MNCVLLFVVLFPEFKLFPESFTVFFAGSAVRFTILPSIDSIDSVTTMAFPALSSPQIPQIYSPSVSALFNSTEVTAGFKEPLVQGLSRIVSLPGPSTA